MSALTQWPLNRRVTLAIYKYVTGASDDPPGPRDTGSVFVSVTATAS